MSTSGSPLNDSAPDHETRPDTPLLSTSISMVSVTSESRSACSSVMLSCVSPNHVMLATSPSIPVIAFTCLSSLTSVRMSARPSANEPARMLSRALVGSYSPAKAETRMRPAGASKLQVPSSAASTNPIGTQYVSESKSSAPVPENASRSINNRIPDRPSPLSLMETCPEISAPE